LKPCAAALLLLTACDRGSLKAPSRSTSSGVIDRAAHAVTAAADEYVQSYFAYRPEQALLNGAPYGDQARVTDNTPAALAAWRAREDSLVTRVKEIDADILIGRPEWVTYGVLRETLEGAIGTRICRHELWDVNSSPAGWQSVFTEVADRQPVGTDSLRGLAVSRASALARYVDNEIANLRSGVAQGYTAPRVIVTAVISQLDGLLKAKPESSAFAAAAERDTTPAFRRDLTHVITSELNPAIRRYRDYLAKTYLSAARTSIGVSALPNGAACYDASVRLSSTLEIPPDSVYRIGLAQTARIQQAMHEIAERDFGMSDVPALLHKIRTDPMYAFTTRQAIRDTAQAAINRARAAVPKWFGILPKAGVVIRDYPEFRQIAGAPGEEMPPGPDGSPAVFLINTYDPTHKNRAGLESLAFHEAIPGHVLQTGIAVELRNAHPLTKYFFKSGFGEGWALYAEGLADEMGLYSSPLSRLGLLTSQAFRAARLVVDPGIHTKGWSREQAMDFMRTHTTEDERAIQGEVDRYIAWPGQATSYMLGQMEILRLRQEAKDALGPRFDIRQFHDRVLEDGNVTLPLLRAKIERWITTVTEQPGER